MSTFSAVLAFSISAAIVTLTPGLDTALFLRTAAVEGRRPAFMAAFGIACGVVIWGSAVAVGLAELLRVSTIAYEIVRWAGAGYLLYLGWQQTVSHFFCESRAWSGSSTG
jgi:threonine/homoserine/homoserine lactone efflux protein